MTNVPNLALEELRKRVKTAGSQTAVAAELDIPQSYLSEVLSGRRDLSDSVLEKLGFTKVIIHVKSQDAPRLIKAIEPTLTTMRGVDRLEKAFTKQVKQVATK